MEDKTTVRKSVVSVISFVTGLVSCGCAPLSILAGFLWMVSGFNLASNSNVNTDLFFWFMRYSPFIGVSMSFVAVVAFAIAAMRHEHEKWVRIVGLLMGLGAVAIHILGILILSNAIGVTPVV